MTENSPKAEKKPFPEAKPIGKEAEKCACAGQKAVQGKCRCAEGEGEEDAKIKELTETLQRLQAEFENYQKRSAKQSAEFALVANASLMEQLLPVLDSLESGVQHNREFAHICEQLYSILRKNGLQKMGLEKGAAFDHDKMDCLMSEPNDGMKDDSVAKVILAGYMLSGKVLRHAKVSIVKNPPKQEAQKGPEGRKPQEGGPRQEGKPRGAEEKK